MGSRAFTLILFAVLAFAVAACSGSGSDAQPGPMPVPAEESAPEPAGPPAPEPTPEPPPEARPFQPAEPSADEHPLDLMVVAFEGDYSREQIKRRLDRALENHGLGKSKGNYGRASAVLEMWRKKLGIKEMEILRYMNRSHAPGVERRFPESAAIAAEVLASAE